jgi:Sulfatase
MKAKLASIRKERGRPARDVFINWRRDAAAPLLAAFGLGHYLIAPVSLTAADVTLPKPEGGFSDAKIGRTYKDSKPGAMALTKAPAGAPNVLIILIDDAGFGQWGTFGGQVPTPNLDRLAKMGLRYTRFHTTALCSPTRAALLTGRNHHSAGTGVITEIGVAYPTDSQKCGDVRRGLAPEWLQYGVHR